MQSKPLWRRPSACAFFALALAACNSLPSEIHREIREASQKLQQTDRQLQRTSGEIRDDLAHSPDLFATVAPDWRARLADAQSKLEGARSDDRQLEALDKSGDHYMAEDFLNSGNQKLHEAASAWASRNNYEITYMPSSGSTSWGGKQ